MSETIIRLSIRIPLTARRDWRVQNERMMTLIAYRSTFLVGPEAKAQFLDGLRSGEGPPHTEDDLKKLREWGHLD